MPVYEYLCDIEQNGCGHQFEETQSFTDEPLKDCPQCHAPALRRLFSLPGLVFKGSGFYCTDNRSQAAKDMHSLESSLKKLDKAISQQK